MKSHERVSLKVLAEIISDYARLCGVDQDKRDILKCMSRTEHEGYKFLTVTLPTYGASLERALEVGYIETGSFKHFKKRSGVPILFGVFLSKVFSSSGVLLSEPNPTAIAAIRQFSYTFKKQKEKCDDETTSKAFKRFKEVELELANVKVDAEVWDDYRRLCHLLWDDVLSQIEVWQSVPKHGPGATADRLTGNRKYKLGCWPERAENYFPLCSFGLPNENAIDSKLYNGIQSLNMEQELPVRVIAVPKTAKTPRIIAIEPTCMQYMQQAISRVLMRVLETHHRTKGHINFQSQSVNQRLCVQASVDRLLATLDLSEASDRVHNDLIAPIFESNPSLWGAIQACRSLTANVDGENIKLSKFASMGSALCFPIESMYFYTLCILGVLRDRKAQIEHTAVIDAASSTYVYGDDIIVPRITTRSVVMALETFGLKVNIHKSFSEGFFRESCGCDSYAGQDVTPVYLRRIITNNTEDTSMILSLVASSNQFYNKGLWLTATVIKQMTEELVGKIPVLGVEAEGVGWTSFTFKPPYTLHDKDPHVKARWNQRLQRLEYLTFVAETRMKRDRIDGYPALMKFFLEPSTKVIGGWDSERNMEQSSRFGTVTLKRRWTRPY